MNVLLFGVTCVGKTTVGRIIAGKLDWDFYDLDEEVSRTQGMSAAEFSQKGTIEQRDRIRGRLIGGLLEKPENKVIAVSPLSYRPAFEKYLRRRDVTAIVLIDTPEHIYKRIEFVDIHDTVYMDAAYKKSHKKEYMFRLTSDITHYGRIYCVIPHRMDVRQDKADVVANRIINIYDLKR